MNKRHWSLLALLLLIAALAAGCGGQKPTADSGAPQGQSFATITDDLGRQVTLKKKPTRIVAASSSFLTPLHAVDAQVVACADSTLGVPDFAKDLPKIGRVYNVDLEKVLAAQPDLVILNKGMNEKLIQPLTTNGIDVLVMDMKSYDNVKNELKVFSQVTGEKEKGDKLIAEMDAKIQAVKDKLPKGERRVAIIHSTAQGLTVQLETSIAGSVAKMLGFTNVAAGMKSLDKKPDSAPYSIETLVEQNPEILFITSMGKMEDIKRSMEAVMASNPAWQTIPAVKNGKVFYLSQEHFLVSPNIHYPEAVEEMAKVLYPEVYK